MNLDNLDNLDNSEEYTPDPKYKEAVAQELSHPIDFRLRNLSYSGLLDLHACPRKYQLNRLQSEKKDTDTDGMQGVTFAFGHAVGDGIQCILMGHTLSETIVKVFLSWQPDIALEDTKRKKSLYLAIAAIKQFHSYFTNVGSKLSQYELVYTEKDGEQIPAIELPFIISMPDGFKFRGKVDAVLRHKVNGEILVLEIKTTAMRFINPAMYKNSSQALGYSVVLDKLFPEYSSYKVFYMPYLTTAMEFEILEFNKSLYQRAVWLRELLLDKDLIITYEEAELFPMRGESCFNYNRECKYFDLCTLSTQRLTKPLTEQIVEDKLKDNEQYYLEVTIQDLIAVQLATADTEAETPPDDNTFDDNLDLEEL